MTFAPKPVLLTFALTLALAACKPPAAQPPEQADAPAPPPAADVPAESPAPPATDPAAPPEMAQAGLAGFGDMKLGSSEDEAKTAWGGELKSLAAAEGSTCHYLLPKWAKDGNELAFMIEDGKFVRYDVGTDKETAPGGGKVGMQADALQALYKDGLQSTPHKYVEGGRYLSITASGVAPSKLVFEVGADGKVTRWRVGLTPQADYVEGCS
jgi:hypothetical protein